MARHTIKKFIAHKPLGEVTEYSLTTPSQSKYLREHSKANAKQVLVAPDPKRSRAVQDTARLQAKINEMRSRSTQSHFSSAEGNPSSTTASIQQQIDQLNN